MKSQQQLEQLNKKVAEGNQTDKVFITLLLLMACGIAMILTFLYFLIHYPVNTLILCAVLYFITKIFKK